MKIVIAPDSFKGSLTAKEAANSIEKGIRKVIKDAEIIKVPMADGGEGTVQSLVDCTRGNIVNLKVKDPLMRDIDAFYGILGENNIAVIEMAAASGLPLLAEKERNPMKTSTYGTGDLIKDALDRGCREFIIGIGGSATNDCGTGMLKALGMRFLNSNNEEINPTGGNLKEIYNIDISGIDSRLKECKITAACDVDNPLYGEYGSAYVFAYQKGADEHMVKILDDNLRYFAELVKRKYKIDIHNHRGAGAAGGLGAALIGFLNAKLKRGIDIVIDKTDLINKVKNADLVITGEGQIDYQTAYGKTPFGVARVAKKFDIPVIAIAGGIGKDVYTLYDKGIDSIFSIVNKPMNLQESMENAEELICSTVENIMRAYVLGKS